MGDGGVILQIRNSEEETIAITDANWKCLVIHEAPSDKSCEKESDPVAGEGSCGFTQIDEPANWDLSDFDDAQWPNAKIYSENDVSPKGGYDDISWAKDAELIWGADLETSDTILCRLSIN